MAEPINGVKPEDPIAGAGIPNEPDAGAAATPPVTPPPEGAKPGAQDVPPESGTVPYQAMKEEREKRQTAQAENEVLRNQLSTLKQQVGGATQYDQYGNPVTPVQQPSGQAEMAKKLD